MPANLSPAYKKAEQAFRAASDDTERLQCLKEMLRTIPKHKGTEHLQADIKSRIKQLSDDLAGPKKAPSRGGPVHAIRPEGAAQVALLGPPNSGKSSLHAKLTGSKASVGPYPHTTQEPLPGMLTHEDVHFQLVDLPPVSADYVPSWLTNALQPADGALLVVDIADPACAEQLEAVIAVLEARKITLTGRWPADPPDERSAAVSDEQRALDPFRLYLPALLIANKTDLNPRPADVRALQELASTRFDVLAVSARTGAGLDALGSALFAKLGIIRVYTKTPGKSAEMDRPFTLRAGATVQDAARLVHKDIATTLRFARAWGQGVYDGQQVGPEHPVADRDILEFHSR
jgi:hypothetical protein